MTVTSLAVSSSSYAADGANRSWPYAFRVDAASDISVVVTSALGVETIYSTGFTATGISSDPPSGTVTFPADLGTPAIAAGSTVTVLRSTALTQPSRIANQGSFYPETHERAFDRLTMIAQDQDARLDSLIDDAAQAAEDAAPGAVQAAIDEALLALPVTRDYGTAATPVPAQVSRSLASHLGDCITLWDEGGGPTKTAAQNTAAIQRCLTKAGSSSGGRPILSQPGPVYFDAAVSSLGPPIHLKSMTTSGAGPGDADSDNTHSAVWLPTFAAGDAITLKSDQPIILEDMRFQQGSGLATSTGAALVTIDAYQTGARNTHSRLDGCRFDGRDIGLRMKRPFNPTVRGCYFGTFTGAGAKYETVASQEATGGLIEGCTFFNGGNAGVGLLTEIGYLTVCGNTHFLGGLIGMQVAIRNNDAGRINVHDAVFEESYYQSIQISSADGHFGAMFNFHDIEFSNVDNTAGFISHFATLEYATTSSLAWLESIRLARCIFRSGLQAVGGNPPNMVWLQAAQISQVDENTFVNLNAGQPKGIVVSGVSTQAALSGGYHSARDNIFAKSGVGAADITARVSGNATYPVRVRDTGGVSFASIGTAYVNVAPGSFVYVTDGVPNSAPLTGGGGGTMAIKEAGGSWYGT